MFDAFGLALLLMPMAGAVGWYLRSRVRPPEAAAAPNTDYLQGVQYLVNDETDKAMDVFIRLLEVDNDTVETHLALGSLFRRRGEVDRALRVHQNLVARPNLDHQYRNRARLELAQDYMKAGVLDRAEGLYLELLEQGMFLDVALASLVSIYEKERDWERAIEATRRQEKVQGRPEPRRLAQYACELAEEALWQKDTKTALQWTKKALADDRDCVRASLLEGKAREAAEDPKAAIRAYRRVVRQDTRYVVETLQPLKRCYAAVDDREQWLTLLHELASAEAPPAVQIALADEIGNGQGVERLAEYLSHTPSWTAFNHLLALNQTELPGPLAAPLETLHTALKATLASAPLYACQQCGFSGRAIHWQCPSCRHWSSMVPVSDVARPGLGARQAAS